MTTSVDRMTIAGVQIMLFKYRRTLTYLPGDCERLDRHTRARFEYWLATGEDLDPQWDVFTESDAENDSRLRDKEECCLFVNMETLAEFQRLGPDRCVNLDDLKQILFFAFHLWRKPSIEEITDRYILRWTRLITLICEKS